MQRSMWRKNMINHINQTDIMHLAEELLKSHQLGHHKMMTFSPVINLPLLGGSVIVNANTIHNLSYPYIWHLLLIPICRGPFSPHLCHILSPHLWYWYLEFEKCCTLCCVRLLIPSWLMYPNNSFKAFIHLFELGQFVMQFIFKKFYSFLKKNH
jgi:hypothetical protein